MHALEEIIGEQLDFYILNDLLLRSRADFAKARGKSQGYIFGILKKKVADDYIKERKKRDAQLLEQERALEERKQMPQLDWRNIWSPSMDQREETGLVDISDLLDDEDDEEPDIWSCDGIPESLRILAQLNLEKEAKLAEDEL